MKRQAFASVPRTKVHRPIDKRIVTVLKATLAATQATTTIVTVVNACTIVGLRVNGNVLQDAGSGISTVMWALVIVRDGTTISTLVTTDGGQLYQPEQNVLAFGHGSCNTTNFYRIDAAPKTQRKMMNGDTLVFVAVAEVTNTVELRAAVQVFCKF